MSVSEEDCQACDLMELAYDDCHHPLHETHIQHASNGGEYKIPESRYFVDGYDASTNTVFEFHGCKRCFPNRHEPHRRNLNRNMWDIRELTVKQMWQCEWRVLKETRSEIAIRRTPCRITILK